MFPPTPLLDPRKSESLRSYFQPIPKNFQMSCRLDFIKLATFLEHPVGRGVTTFFKSRTVFIDRPRSAYFASRWHAASIIFDGDLTTV
jgi:hypothetical protein